MAKPQRHEELRTVDEFGRLSLGKQLANETFAIERKGDGTLVLTPVAIIPKRELWLWKNKEALREVKLGLQESARGETTYLGSFSQYAEDDLD